MFDSLLGLEASWVDEEREDGRKKAESAGFAQARDLGVVKGKEIGMEIGWYKGCMIGWKRILDNQPDRNTDRLCKAMKRLNDSIVAFPRDPSVEDFWELLDKVRGKFKVVLAILFKHQPEKIRLYKFNAEGKKPTAPTDSGISF
eukprot:TRINITY_DN22200_c0_g1_i1.p1 TRINITY_DN22200_c0_g1~~TRINITY_DN22200_c0_g1_i1.p1  ORF type:complete len:144 (-),score=24.31 TRINITY_DN22200_c0_g1_i1:64-495(-)